MSPASRASFKCGPAVFISPHFDDAVLSCAGAIAEGCVVVTVFSSGPEHVDPLPLWDRECQVFQPGDNGAAIRQLEDDAALASLGADGVRLGLWESQYTADFSSPVT